MEKMEFEKDTKEKYQRYCGYCVLKTAVAGTSLVVQWVALSASRAEDAGSIPGWGNCVVWPKNYFFFP